ncbi:MAG TPA: TetR/AcrR family transcriptional regulator [Candidatus Aminicenantes bacterium]|nr:TetR/AcrR family transcriptional regulator [Candidatus Aminicenantes bacterium]HDT13552.1 TetR/AcrR family transcriptional regulator [Candidatus Aminicenantes bacterium]
MKTSDLRRERDLQRRAYYRDVVLRAAERVILRKGYSALTMDDVAREAQLSKATIYKYVAGKGALLIEIVGQAFDNVKAAVTGVVDAPGSAGDKLGRLVQAILKSEEDARHFNRVLWMDKAMFRLMRLFAHPPAKAGAAPAADRKLLATVKQKRQEIIDLGARVLDEGIATGEFRPMDTGQASAFIEAVLQGYMHMRLWQGDAPLVPDAGARLTTFIIEGIRNPDQAGKEN